MRHVDFQRHLICGAVKRCHVKSPGETSLDTPADANVLLNEPRCGIIPTLMSEIAARIVRVAEDFIFRPDSIGSAQVTMNHHSPSWETRLQSLRPALLTQAEALMRPGVHTRDEASDLVQQTLLEAHRDAWQLRPLNDAQLFGWLRTALRHNLIDSIRRATSQRIDVRRHAEQGHLADSFCRLDELLVSNDTSPSQAMERREATASLLRMIDALPAPQRLAVTLKHVRGLSLQQVATEMRRSESAVAGLLHRGRKRLLQCIQDQGCESSHVR